MNIKSFILILVTLLFNISLSLSTSSSSKELSRGWGEDIKWISITDAYRVAKELNKPVMTIIWKSWCGSCKALKPLIAESEAFLKLSTKFVMVNAGDDEEPTSEDYKIDGGYIPRIYFSNSDAKVMKDIVNVGGNAKYLYYYSDVDSILRSMTTVLNQLKDGKVLEVDVDTDTGVEENRLDL
jgi:protein-disulfide reductase (glutathione)